MNMAPKSYRQRLMLAAACGLVALAAPGFAADAPTSSGVAATLAQASTTATENVVVKAAKRLLREKNSPSAVTELGTAQIKANSPAGNPGTLLTQAPSVYAYSQGLGDNAPELTIRGLRGLEIASTLDGVPTQDLLAPGGFYLAQNIGGLFTNSQISGVSLYPGVAYPDKNTFGTIGGTVAYASKRPTDDHYFDVTGTVGSYGTYKEGFEFNSGRIDSPLGTGDNAAKFLLQYNNFQTQGFIDGTPNRENEMLAAFDKPYADGLSKFQVTAIYNTAVGLIQNEPVPLPYLSQNGKFSNYPTNLTFAKQNNDWASLIIRDDHYVNDYLTVGATAFYLANDQQLENYGATQLNIPGPDIANGMGQLTVKGAGPFINNPAGFGEGGLYGPPSLTQDPNTGTGPAIYPLGIYGGGTGGYFYGKGHHYDPTRYFSDLKACPQALQDLYANETGSKYNAPCGLNDQITGSHSDTYGIQPRVLITPPEFMGINNTIKLGGMLAKETSPSGYTYLGAYAGTAQTEANAYNDPTGGTQRTIYQAYAQDKIDLLENTLHITPGVTLEGTKSSFLSGAVRCSRHKESCSKGAAYWGPDGAAGPNGILTVDGSGTSIDHYAAYKAVKWDREVLPFLNLSYDFDKVLPALKGLSLYASTGSSALFAPVGDFGPNTAGPPPGASIVHMYEAGVKYNTNDVSLTADYFYQKVDRDFGYFSFQSGPQNGEAVYSGFGQREFKGVEAAATWQVDKNWQVFGNVSHTLAKYLTSGFALDTVSQDQYGIVLKGDPVSGIPAWLGNFGVDYDRKSTFVDNDEAEIRFAGRYSGHQFSTYDYGGNDYLKPLNFKGLEKLDFTGCDGTANGSCAAYTRYNQVTGATVTDTKGKGISPFVIFNLDATYTMPTPQLPVVKELSFNMNVQNLFNHFYYQYFYKQISPASCGTITSGPLKGLPANNYACGESFADGIPGQPFSAFFTVRARF